jgi:hypothetical protein
MLAIETGFSVRCVREKLKEAEETGWIKRELCKSADRGKGWKFTEYELTVPERLAHLIPINKVRQDMPVQEDGAANNVTSTGTTCLLTSNTTSNKEQASPDDLFSGSAIAFLKAKGLKEKQAFSLLGKLKKEAPEDWQRVVGNLIATDPDNPAAYINAALQRNGPATAAYELKESPWGG